MEVNEEYYSFIGNKQDTFRDTPMQELTKLKDENLRTAAGSGILRAMEDKPNVTFENRESAHEFVITIKREPAIDDQASDQVNNQVGNQDSNQADDQVSDQVSDQAMHQVANQETNQVNHPKPQLTKKEKDIVNFCSVPRTAQEILNRMGLTQHSVNRKRHILPLVEKGVLEMTNPDNPIDPNQKYRKKK